MRVAHVSFLLVAAAMLLGLVPAIAETADYPISVTQVVDPCKAVKKDVVLVHFLGSNNAPATATLNEFMQDIVPSWALNNGRLPRPANVPTLVENVTVPHQGKCFIVDDQQGPCPPGCVRKDKRPRLPVYLRVKISNLPDHQVCEDRNERFKGIVADPWKIESYFITTYTVVCRVTKNHKTLPYAHVTKKVETGAYKKFNWVDP